MAGAFVRNDAHGDPTGELLFRVGGTWDRTKGCYVDTQPSRGRIWGVNEAQLGLVDDLREWIEKRRRGDDSRNIIIEAGGARGGGKSHGCVLICDALALELPGSKVWIFNPTLDKREEIEDFLRSTLPIIWAKNPLRWPTSVPDCRFRLVNESSIRNLSGEIPQSAKRGEAECILINEGQLQRRKVFSLALYGIRKRGGLLMVATNPPEETFPAGEWVLDLRENIEAGKIAGTFRDIDPRKNPSVHEPTMGKIAAAIEAVDPEAAAADVRNEWNRLGEFVYSRFRPFDRIIEGIDAPPGAAVGDAVATEHGTGTIQILAAGRATVHLPSMVRDPPDIGEDITTEALRRAGVSGRYAVAIATDHQTHPHQAAAAAHVYRGADDKNVYYFTDEIIVAGSAVTEIDLSDALYAGEGAAQIEYTPEVAILIPDCSGDWQVANRDAATTSIQVLESQLWKCKPPTEIMRPDRSRHPKNPPVHHSIAQVSDVMREGRFFVAPCCKWIIASGPKVPYRKDGDTVKISQKGGYAHIWDCIRYLIWLLEPKKKRKVAPPRAGDIRAIEMVRGGPRVL